MVGAEGGFFLEIWGTTLLETAPSDPTFEKTRIQHLSYFVCMYILFIRIKYVFYVWKDGQTA